MSDIPTSSQEHTRDLPFEILQQIFVTGWSSSQEQGRIAFSVRLTHVCRSWRTIALCTSELWSYLFLQSASLQRDLLPAMLERSRKHTFDVHFAAQEPVLFTNSTAGVFAKHSHRWKSLSLSVRYFADVNFFAKLLNDTAPHRLEHLSITVHHPPRPFDGAILHAAPLLGQCIPALTSLHVVNYPTRLLPSMVSTLTKLHLSGARAGPLVDIQKIGDLLENSPCLQELYLIDCYLNLMALTTIRQERRLLPKLRLLTMRRVPLGDVFAFSVRVLYPALESLTLDHIIWDGTEALFPAFPICMGLYGVSLRRFSFSGADLRSIADIEAFMNSPHIQDVSLLGGDSDALVSILGRENQPGWPGLQKLALSQCSPYLVRTMIAARIEMSLPIRELYLPGELLADPDYNSWLIWLTDNVDVLGDIKSVVTPSCQDS